MRREQSVGNIGIATGAWAKRLILNIVKIG